MNYIDPKEDQTTPQFSNIRDTSRRFLILLGLLAVLALVGLAGARPAYRWFKVKRALSMVREGETAAETGDWIQVGRVVQTTLRLAPEEVRVLRLAARYCTESNLPGGLNYWQMVEQREPLNLEDQYAFARLAVFFGRTDVSSRLLQQLVATNKIAPQVLKLAVLHAEALGSSRDAISAARRWVSESPGDPEAENSLANLLIGQPSPELRREARGLLWGLVLGKGAHSTNAIEKLVASTELSQGENLVLLKQIEDRPDQLVNSYILRDKLNPERRPELIESLIKAAVENGSPRQLAAAASWLADIEKPERILDVLPLRLAESNPTLLTGRLQALMQLGEVTEVKRFLEMDTTKVEPFMLHCLRAFSAKKSNKPQLMAGHFENALTAAGNVPSRLRFIAGYAETVGSPAAAISAYRRLMKWPPAMLSASQNILRLATAMNDTHVLRDTVDELSNYLPGDHGVAILDAYLSALLQNTSARSKADLLRQLGEKSAQNDAQLALALIELRIGEAPAALSRLEKLPPDWVQASPQCGAVFAATLAANQQRESAGRMARSLDVSKLRPEELELVKALRQ